jgi:hypothetical protein
MKSILIALAMSFTAMFAHAEVNNTNSDNTADQVDFAGKLTWNCGIAFTGAAGGIKIILGRFNTVATGKLSCIDLEGNHFTKDVMLTIGSYFIGPVVGIGYFKFAGVSSHISLFNCPPDVLFGHYLVTQGQGAFGLGGGVFTAVRVHPPEIALNVSIKLQYGIGFQAGVESMTLTPL